MAKYLITQTLMGSFSYLMDCRDEVKDSAYEDFIKTLNREPKETTPEMQNGRDFEDLVYAIAEGKNVLQRGDPTVTKGYEGDTEIGDGNIIYPKWYNGAFKVAQYILNAPSQVPLYGETSVHGLDLLVYGILDSLKAGTIYDVKFSNKSFGSAELAGKYLHSPQHPTYFFLCPEAKDFIYLVSDGEDIYTERYTRKMSRDFHDVADELLRFLEVSNLLETYKEKWDTEKANWHGKQ